MHVGLFLTDVGSLNADGRPGGLYVAADAGIKSALFLMAGVILNRYGSVDEVDLHACGRQARLLPWFMVLAGFALVLQRQFGM